MSFYPGILIKKKTSCNVITLLGPPDPPSGKPCVSANTDGSVTIAWSSSPYDGGKIVTGFEVEYSLVGSEVWTTATDNCYSLSYVLEGLQPGARYVFRVRALNVHGYSKPGQESDVLQLEEKSKNFLLTFSYTKSKYFCWVLPVTRLNVALSTF